MAIRQLVKKISGPLPVISVCTGLLLLLCILIIRSLSEDSSGELHFWITLLGSIGITILIFFLVANTYALFRQYQRDEIGSKLTSKLVCIFLFLTLIPFSLVYYFSIQFLNKGVDSWFDVRVEQAVQDALLLGQTSLETIKQEIVSDVESYAQNLTKSINRTELLRTLDDIRELEDYTELSLYTHDGRIVAFSSSDPNKLLPDTPSDAVFSDLRLNQTYTSLEPLSNTQQFRVVAPIRSQELGRSTYALQAIKLLPLRYASLANSVETALNQYDQMLFARGPLKFSLILTLSLISLASLLFSILTAVYLSKRLVAPISSLAIGTRQIAAGDYGAILPVESTDELGILVHSFNDMSSKIEDAQHAVITSQQETEEQKGYLEAILTNLSSGVFAFDSQHKLRIHNSAANDILGLDLQRFTGQSAIDLATQEHSIAKFFKLIANGINSQQDEWQDEINLLGMHGRQMLIVRGSILKTIPEADNNYVIVFDDVTNLIQAQRDAAWGEVARRLAHEIKNPLTPIQLCAERIHNKFLHEVSDDLRPTLERSTRTIVQQVESMKEMVNAFSSYAQPVRAKLSPLKINQLIRDVVELHSTALQPTKIGFELEESLPPIKANASALRQVLNNLIINAHHAIKESANTETTGHLTIRSKFADQVSGNYIDIEIEDNGDGIPEDIRDSLFDPYVSSKAKGSGLGLAIVKRIVEEHSGSVWVEAGEINGTCMHIRLPINAQQTYRGNRSQNTLHSSQDDISPTTTVDGASKR